MIAMQRGFKSKIDAGGVNIDQAVYIDVGIDGNGEYDFSCFGLDENEKLSDENYFIFYNQPNSPGNEITLTTNGGKAVFQALLASLPDHIRRLRFAVSIDGAGSMRDIKNCSVRITQNGAVNFTFDLQGSDFNNQKAIIIVEIYNKGEWRIAAIGNGFAGGLDALLKDVGGSEASDGNSSAPQPRSNSAPQSKIPPQVAAQMQTPPSSAVVSAVDNVPVSGRNAEGFERKDDDWV
jgi:stress response protein SCP2